jgi:serine/threonine protein kinase
LQDFIRRHSYDVPAAAKAQIAAQVVEAVCYLHQMGVAHRDIKTENVILGSDGLVKLIDFGFATTVAKGETHCGTPNYMAPELFEKKGAYQPTKVDVWALGVLLYYLY